MPEVKVGQGLVKVWLDQKTALSALKIGFSGAWSKGQGLL